MKLNPVTFAAPLNRLQRTLVLIGLLALPVASRCAAPVDQELDLGRAVQPVPMTARLADPDYFIWCGSMAKADDGKYYLYYSRWPKATGFGGWVTHSEIAYAVADTPLGPYRHAGVALAPRGPDYWDGMVTHNPQVLRVGRKFYLFYMGNRGDGKSYWVHRNQQRVGLASADSPAGPWKRLDRPIVDVNPDKTAFDALCTNNPAAAIRPDGSVLLLYKAVSDNGSERGGPVRFGAAIAQSIEGPYVKQAGRIFEPDAAHKDQWMVAEDPFVWYSERFGRRYYAIVRDVVGMYTGVAGGIALIESVDGLHWAAAKHPAVLGDKVLNVDGSSTNTHLQRPQIYFENDTPRVLFGALDVITNKKRTDSYNVHIPLSVP